MADNFLENHHAEYEQKKQRWLKKKASHLPKSFTRVGRGFPSRNNDDRLTNVRPTNKPQDVERGFPSRHSSQNMTITEFFNKQRSEWQLAKKNYDDLANVKVTPLVLSTGVTVHKQCNPARIVSTGAKIDKATLAKRPCFLCDKNRPAEQAALPFAAVPEVSPSGSAAVPEAATVPKAATVPEASASGSLSHFQLLINPFPILPTHFTIPSKQHELQQIKPYFPVMLDFVDENPDCFIFYNGPRSGASAPDHMHFQAGLVKDVPFYNQAATVPDVFPSGSATVPEASASGSPLLKRCKWPGANVTFAYDNKQSAIDEFYRIYDLLPIPTGEYEPMFNVFARKVEGRYEVTLFLRSQHRPACYGMEADNRLVSPGALDMAGLLITPRLEDYESITAEEAEAIYNEVSSPVLLDYLAYNESHEGRKIAVGLIETEGEIRYSFNGEYKKLELLNDTIFIPANDSCTFTIENIIIGVDFHWQQERKLTYSGILKLTKTPDGKNVAINILPIEDYLKSVISSEMSAMSDKELLKAHAILSRSWLIANIEGVHNESCTDEEGLKWYDRSAHTIYDVCADDHCQRYQGVTMQTSPLVEEAVEETRGKVIMYNGKICDARFSKCCGGKSEEYEYCWDNTSHPYLVSVDCPFCNTAKQFDSKEEEQKVLQQVLNDYDLETRHFYDWTATYENADIKEIIPLERGKSGRLWKIKIVYNDGREEIVGKELEIRRRLSDSHLYSSWFNIHKAATLTSAAVPGATTSAKAGTFIIEGRGWGHGVGLCQIGAAVMAAKGYKYDEILLHYFPKSQIL